MEPSSSARAVSELFIARFHHRVEGHGLSGANGRALSFADFMDLALYDPDVGYYRRARERVGRAGADFYTAASMNGVFGPLVAAAAVSLLEARQPGEFTFVEIGAEPGRGVLDGVEHQFRAVRTIRVGEPLALAGRLIVFSNEVFDAQPFHRVVRRAGTWRERGVHLADGALAWVDLPELSTPVALMADALPADAPDGHVIDVPLAAANLASAIARQSWSGLFLAFDYGRTWEVLATEYPEGTARAYARHRQSNDLLAAPGEQDLTCHICWDWLVGPLRDNGFAALGRESQESFFVRRATTAVQAIMESDPDPLSLARTQLKHLLHPALMGQRFEVLWGWREVV